jgi:hypothetical protein
MPGQVNTLMIDLRLVSYPTPEEIEKLVVKPIEVFTETKFIKTCSEALGRRTVCLEAVEGLENAFALIRVYDREREDDNVLLTVTVEMPG